jgi:pyridinium-3,5-bisthiocarboxylic acid mononucleotide nickel chelatase
VDIVGTAVALSWLRPSRVTARRVPLGGGMVKTAHGMLPVPAPATLELLKGAEVEAGGEFELTTPTGAAILAASVGKYCELPPMKIAGVGWGAGDRELHDRPNLLRVVVGHPSEQVVEQESLSVIEANLDDMNPELSEPLMEALFAAGALDVWFAPIVMKKGRPALMVGALCESAKRDEVVKACLRESSTIGVRHHAVARTVLARRFVEVDTPFGKIPIKVAGEDEQVINAAPEYDACRRAAKEHGVPVKQVYAAALSAFFPSYNRPR